MSEHRVTAQPAENNRWIPRLLLWLDRLHGTKRGNRAASSAS